MKDKYRLNIPRLNILNDDQLELLHLSTLEVLRRTGVEVKEPKALEILKKGGCFVDGEPGAPIPTPMTSRHPSRAPYGL